MALNRIENSGATFLRVFFGNTNERQLNSPEPKEKSCLEHKINRIEIYDVDFL